MNQQVANRLSATRPERQPPVELAPARGRTQIKDLCRMTSVSLDTFTRLLGVSRRAVGGWISGNEKPNKSNQKKLNELFRLFTALTEVVDVNKIGPWLEQPNPEFEGSTPLQMIERGESDRIWRMLETGHVLGASLVVRDRSRFGLHDEVKKNLVLRVTQELRRR